MTERPANTSDPPAAAGGEPAYLSRSQVARLFGVSASSVTRWAREGLIRAARTPGGHYRFPAEETRRAAASLAAGEPARPDGKP
ncbi:MAG: helix-turn-helix domain-containing protein [Thermoanaerobaculia bacterium]